MPLEETITLLVMPRNAQTVVVCARKPTARRRTANCDNPRASTAQENEGAASARNPRQPTLGADNAHAQGGKMHNGTQQRRRRSKCNMPLRPTANRKFSAF